MQAGSDHTGPFTGMLQGPFYAKGQCLPEKTGCDLVFILCDTQIRGVALTGGNGHYFLFVVDAL